jgi:hypothetical protein
MQRRLNIVHWQTSAGDPIRIAGTTVTPEAWALVVQLPFGGFVWNRPVALLLENDAGSRRLPIVDMTRTIQVALLGATLAVWLLGARRRGRS